MIPACWRPLLNDLETLYIPWFLSGAEGMGLNHSMYARCVRGVVAREDRGNMSEITLDGIWKMTWIWAILWPGRMSARTCLYGTQNPPWIPCALSSCWPVWTRTVLKCAGMVHPCVSTCSGRIWILSTIAPSLIVPNLILWKTGMWWNAIRVFSPQLCKARPEREGSLRCARKSPKRS